MKIVYLAAGAAGMYCGSCLHDNTLAAALIEAGQDVTLVPTYTPLRLDEADVSQSRVFFGGINVYLQQKSSLFRHTPWFLDHLLDSPALIKLATRFGPGVDAARLGDLTVSMLEGEHGHQRKELAKLVRWLQREVKPDVVHLSNAMLLGMAREIAKLGIPIVCSLSGEDVFLEKVIEPHYSRARQALRERATDAAAFVAMNRYYADFMIDYMALPADRVNVIPHGINLAGHGSRPAERGGGPFVIGYFARVCAEKGLHNLVAAMELLNDDASLPPIRLRAAGYLSREDEAYLQAIRSRVSQWREPQRFEYQGELSREGKIAFLQSLDLMSVPTTYHESKGLSVLEALANAVPVVLPAHGAFPELIADTGGGLLVEPESPAALAAAIKELILDPRRAAQLGIQGQRAIRERYNAESMARATLAVYRSVERGMRSAE